MQSGVAAINPWKYSEDNKITARSWAGLFFFFLSFCDLHWSAVQVKSSHSRPRRVPLPSPPFETVFRPPSSGRAGALEKPWRGEAHPPTLLSSPLFTSLPWPEKEGTAEPQRSLTSGSLSPRCHPGSNTHPAAAPPPPEPSAWLPSTDASPSPPVPRPLLYPQQDPRMQPRPAPFGCLAVAANAAAVAAAAPSATRCNEAGGAPRPLPSLCAPAMHTQLLQTPAKDHKCSRRLLLPVAPAGLRQPLPTAAGAKAPAQITPRTRPEQSAQPSLALLQARAASKVCLTRPAGLFRLHPRPPGLEGRAGSLGSRLPSAPCSSRGSFCLHQPAPCGIAQSLLRASFCWAGAKNAAPLTNCRSSGDGAPARGPLLSLGSLFSLPLKISLSVSPSNC